MNISGMEFKSDNRRGGRVSKFELSILRAMTSDSVCNREYLTVADYARVTRVSKVSAHRYWQHIQDNFGGMAYYLGGYVQAVVWQGQKLFCVVKDDNNG